MADSTMTLQYDGSSLLLNGEKFKWFMDNMFTTYRIWR